MSWLVWSFQWWRVNVLGERGCDEDRGEAANTSDEGGLSSVKVLVSDIFVLGVCAAVYNDTEDDEDLVVG